MSLGPFDLPGEPFLALYSALLAMTIVASFFIPRWLRPEGRAPRNLDTDQLAWLVGGKPRWIDTVMSRLLGRRALSMVGKNRFQPERRDAWRSEAERSVLRLPAPTPWSTIERELAPHAAPIERALVSADLLMDRPTTLQMRFWSTLPYLLLLAFGAIKWDVGVMRVRPVGYLTGLLILTAIFALIRWLAVDRRTRAGQAAVAEARSRSQRLRRAPAEGETDLGVALFGTVVLSGSDWSSYHQFRTSSSSGDSGGGGSDGGGGCGGGGCGGCGGS